jgi:cytidylate kinase
VRHIVEGAADDGQAVIVGRGAQMILADRRDVLRVRIIAPLEQRVAYVSRREQLDAAGARDRIEREERGRERYLRSSYRRASDDAYLYDLVVNTGALDLDSAVALIAVALERKAALLALSPEELGPAAGLSPYPAPPGRLRPRRRADNAR